MAQESRLVIVIDAKNAERNARNLGNELNSIERRGDFATKSMDGLSVATRQLAGYMAGLVTVGTAISRMDTYTGLQNRLKLVTSSQVELNQALKDTFNIAQATGQAWDSTAQVYQRFADNAKRLGITLQQTSSLTETVAKAISISGGSAASAEAALVQFGQALASGVLRGEEFNSIAEQAPGLLKAIATGLGTNIGQLRAMAADGKLTADVVVKSLEKAKVSVDDLFSKTDFTIGNSFTMLNNAITQFIGEAGKSSGAAQTLSGSIQALAGNLDTLMTAMMIGGAYWLGTYIPAIYASGVAVVAKTKELAAQTVVQYAAIQAERSASAQEVVSLEAKLATIQATRVQIVEELKLELRRMKSQISTQGVINAELRMGLLRQQQAKINVELTATETALAAAQARSAAAGAASVGIGARLLGVLGGPVGIGITVASLAAGYLLMRDNTAEANQKLKEQAEVANQAADELRKLHGVEKQSAINDMTTALEAQNKALRDAELAAGAALIDIQNFAQGNIEVTKISNEARVGTISYTEALQRLNGMSIPPDIYNALKKQVEEYNQAYFAGVKLVDGLKAVGVEAKLQGNAAQNAANQNNIHANSLDGVAGAANNATNALSDYLKKLQQSTFKTELTNKLIGNYGFDPERAKAFAEAYVQNGNKISSQDAKIIDQNLAANRKLQASEEAVAQAKRDSAAASRKSNAESSKANREAIKEANEAKRLYEEQARLRDQFADSYAPKLTQTENDLQRELAEIRKANFGVEEKDYIAKATARAELNKELYLRELTNEINQFQWSEEQKLKYSYETKQMQIKEGTELTDDLKQIRLDALKQEYDQEIGMIQLTQEQRLFQAKQSYMREVDVMRERYRLEREEIARTEKDPQRRSQLLEASARAEDYDFQQRRRDSSNSFSDMRADMGGYSTYQNQESELNDRREIIAEALEWENITAEEAREANLAAERDYLLKRAKLNSYYGEQITGSMVDMLAAAGDKQSAIYKAMFAANKAFAIAQSLISIQAGIAQAANNPFPYNLVGMATVAAETASIVGNIQSVAGIFHGGKDYVPKEATYLLDEGERVVSPRQNQDLTNFLASQREMNQYNAINSNPTNGGATVLEPIVNVYVMEGQTADVTRNDDGSLDVRIRQIAGEVAEQTMVASLSNPNSRINKSMKQNFNVAPKR